MVSLISATKYLEILKHLGERNWVNNTSAIYWLYFRDFFRNSAEIVPLKVLFINGLLHSLPYYAKLKFEHIDYNLFTLIIHGLYF